MNKRLLLLSIVTFLSILLLSSCSDDPSSVSNEPPALPSEASMDIDLSTLLGTTQETDTSATTQEINHYIQAVYKAGALEGVIEGNLARPKQLLAAAQDTMAELNEDQHWQWEYQSTIGYNQYAVRLVAEQIAAATVNWSLFVATDSLDIENRLYFSGTTTEEGQKGVWIVNSLNNTESDPVAEIDWELQEDSTRLRLDILADENGSAGSYIDYGTDGSVNTVNTIEYYNTDSGQTNIIQWNADTRAGYIIAPDVNNGEQACWDAELQDTSCVE